MNLCNRTRLNESINIGITVNRREETKVKVRVKKMKSRDRRQCRERRCWDALNISLTVRLCAEKVEKG